ncbi:ATP-binding cassette domain-containing protein [Bifidobacteriaceae bacterium NR044]|uniref:ABC transporter related protein n=1 Tax=Gardnerella greenwoodii 00703Dmash TaxID=698960 RepID=I4M6L7_9BIFI|nr:MULTISPECIES: nitrate/sulfonate/bicarbonate ABC transporter ATP-binding protein [Gardnerella]EIK84857.1 ABC transporter related protein [Gardnerella greenwoodii 00703Dmash]MBF9308132.1 ATP-binding cassette domain-containing protein [Bifidobacteriaceae bacterium NR043]MBF9354094.1 ATP-binding cassette domain-containing protein [Bifidobacteriaceae bacterium NR044]RFT37986.1 ABC transporter ATP-binding protein [Bifidobacteriaceae bacterium NR003]
MNTLKSNAKTAQSSITSDIIDAKHISQSFTSDSGTTQHVLHDISFTLREGEIVAILGRSGAGKSTFLRTMAGLVQPTEGTVTYRGRELTGPNPGVAIVFQTFALMPWLTVQDNVELGLRARGVSKEKRTELALAAIDAIGLDGFETAYPKELSGGMRQRVGIARALVLRPDALFMDEPFSALDVLTAENLRQEVLKLWSSEERDIKSVLIVTHNIEEAVQMADRVVVLGSHPGHLIADVQVDLPRPRDKHSAEFEAMVDNLYAILTGSAPESASEQESSQSNDLQNQTQSADTEDAEDDEAAAIADMLIQRHHDDEDEDKQSEDEAESGEVKAEPVSVRLLPNATPGGMAGLLDVISENPDGIDLADLAADLSFEIDDLFPLVDAGTMLNLLTAENGHITITSAGEEWHNADILHSKQVFARLAIEHAPLVHAIDQALSRNRNGKLRGELILDLLRSKHTDALARQQFDIAISWGRYGELFDYDADDDELTRTVETAPLDGVAR